MRPSHALAFALLVSLFLGIATTPALACEQDQCPTLDKLAVPAFWVSAAANTGFLAVDLVQAVRRRRIGPALAWAEVASGGGQLAFWSYYSYREIESDSIGAVVTVFMAAWSAPYLAHGVLTLATDSTADPHASREFMSPSLSVGWSGDSASVTLSGQF